MNGTFYVSALTMGLVGSTHCVVMCGGVVAMSCSALPLVRRQRTLAQLPYVLAYNAGRIVSYAVAGAAAGSVGAALITFGPVGRGPVLLRLFAALTMLGVGLHIAGLSAVLRWMEKAGAPLWRLVAPMAKRLLPVRHPSSALALGLVWGWMPCGLVYAALATAGTSGSGFAGAATMTAFGLGTLPMLVAMGSAGAAVARMARLRPVRVAAGAAMMAFGVLQLVHVGESLSTGAGRGAAGGACCPNHHA
ncbi:MAG: sulfite exporter TauE/SafE family protein [Polyangiaceae bacterium]|jgi:sulfite exporter TauE/SafE